jgi:hypothetical protein
MCGKTKLGIAMQDMQEWLVATLMRVVHHFREVAHRLMSMDTKKQGNCFVCFHFSDSVLIANDIEISQKIWATIDMPWADISRQTNAGTPSRTATHRTTCFS